MEHDVVVIQSEHPSKATREKAEAVSGIEDNRRGDKTRQTSRTRGSGIRRQTADSYNEEACRTTTA
ncbi:unnamed protein product [Acanthoscelides obtectus]|uniref:Uncharacterized protein n=1 Tax=Acanthoscelides obtectus TaxID=200917 RepID=A0A9P0LPJ6_ACAOB|nr:unnamed protein product [Acanthoscelides obtectus]CAK1670761.1 hypothetical protein AOBTE_LOCUS27811 [Acanthoscelides obtectus]